MTTETTFNINPIPPAFSGQGGCLRAWAGLRLPACAFYFSADGGNRMKKKDLPDWIYQPSFEEVLGIIKERREAHINNLNEKTKKEVSK